ncbi:hypothetical protein GCM10010309_63310 [Streptomyces violaceochromogenes]|nr:hypothetical protein GCM10010309_63310 [Streptomyces violaceochromogenes]
MFGVREFTVTEEVGAAKVRDVVRAVVTERAPHELPLVEGLFRFDDEDGLDLTAVSPPGAAQCGPARAPLLVRGPGPGPGGVAVAVGQDVCQARVRRTATVSPTVTGRL